MKPTALIKSAAIVILMIAVFTILSELFPAVKGFFALFGHHWIGKSLLSLVALGILYFVFARFELEQGEVNAQWLIGSVIVSGLAIAGFYTAHFF